MVCCCWTIALLAIPVYYIARWFWELFKLDDLEKKAVLITGCDSGFGQIAALQCARAGIPTFAGCLTEEGVSELKEEESSNQLRPFVLDITNDESVKNAVKFVDENLKSEEYLWALIENAGAFTVYGPDDWTIPVDYLFSFDVNCLGAIRITHAFKKHIKRAGGRIIATSSVAGRMTFPYTGPYAVAKHGVEAYIDGIRQELAPWGVKCSLIEPGAFRTPLLKDSKHKERVEHVWDRLDSETKEEYGEIFKNQHVENWIKTLNFLSSSNFSTVTDCYFHAITAKYPRCRYRCGWDSMFFYIPVTYLPTEIMDWIFKIVIQNGIKEGPVKPAVFMKKEKSH